MRRGFSVAALSAVPVLLLLGLVARNDVSKEQAAEKRADTAVYQQIVQEPAGNLQPSDAVRVHGRETPPCKGDSGSGPSVVRGYAWPGEPDELFVFYQAELAKLGWQSLERELQPSAGGDLEDLSGTKSFDGYTLRIEVRTVKYGDQNFDLILWTNPIQDCY